MVSARFLARRLQAAKEGKICKVLDIAAGHGMFVNSCKAEIRTRKYGGGLGTRCRSREGKCRGRPRGRSRIFPSGKRVGGRPGVGRGAYDVVWLLTNILPTLIIPTCEN